MRDALTIFVNGLEHQVTGAAVFRPLSDFLRYDLGLTGTKIVCAEGDCGSCTVMIGRLNSSNKQIGYRAICSCIQYLYQLDGTHIITVEGLSKDGIPHPIQSAMAENHGAQCGFCTPGFVMAMCASINEHGPRDAHEARRDLVGNLCRCTGYEPILNVAAAIAEDHIAKITDLYPDSEIFNKLAGSLSRELKISYDDLVFYKPANLAQALGFRAANPTCNIISGGTDLGVFMNKGKLSPKIVMSVNHLPEIRGIECNKQSLNVGAACSLTELERTTKSVIPAFSELLVWFGSPLIKNAGTLGGNIVNGSPIGDTMPALFVLNAQLELASQKRTRSVNINDFYTGYRRTVMQPDELLTRITIPIPANDERLKLYKVSKRKDLDISTVAVAFLIKFAKSPGPDAKIAQNGPSTSNHAALGNGVSENCKIELARVCFAGVAATIVRLPVVEELLSCREFNLETFLEAGKLARTTLKPISDVRGSTLYREQLIENLFIKLYHDLAGGVLCHS